MNDTQVRKFSGIAPALKQVAVCLPPVILSLVGLAVLAREKRGRPAATLAAAGRTGPAAVPTGRRAGGG
ncbi:MAG: hypothetical protein U1E66_08480 [Rhodospirillales bacterium]